MHIINLLIQLLATYWLDLVIVMAFTIICLLLLKRGRKDLVARIIYGLVVQAEQQLGSKTGQEKYAHVMAQVYAKLPLILRLLFTKDDIELFLEDAVLALKNRLTDQDVNLLSYMDEKKEH